MNIDRVASILEQLAVSFFTFAESLFRASLVGHVARHSAYDRRVDTFGAQRIVVLPDAALTRTGLDHHESAADAAFLKRSHIILELIADFRRQNIADVSLAHE